MSTCRQVSSTITTHLTGRRYHMEPVPAVLFYPAVTRTAPNVALKNRVELHLMTPGADQLTGAWWIN